MTILLENIDVNKLEIRPPKKQNATRPKFILFHDNQRLRGIVLPELMAPFGGSESKNYPGLFSLVLSFEGMEGSDNRAKRLQRAHEKVSSIDNKIRELMAQKLDMIFPKETKRGVDPSLLVNRYQSFIKTPEDGYADNITFKLQREIECKSQDEKARMSEAETLKLSKTFHHLPDFDHLLVDNEQKPVEVTTDNIHTVLPRNSRVKAIVELMYLYVSPEGLKASWSIGAARRITTGSAETYTIDRDSDSEHEDDDANEEEDHDVHDGDEDME